MRRYVAVALIGVLLLGVSAVPASAAWGSCPSGRFCTFSGVGGTGSIDTYTAASLADCENTHAGSDNSASSVYNRTALYVVLKKGTNCGGASSFTVQPGAAVNNLADYCCAWDNSVSSFRLR